MKLPKLFGQTKLGKIKIWEITILENQDGSSEYIVTHGLSDGKKAISKQVIKSGKNIGKVNQTTTLEQALSEAQSKWQKQIDSGYCENIKDIKVGNKREFFLPMLAQRYDQQGLKIKWPAFLQPKLDGFRCLARKDNGKVTLWSRKGKSFEIPKEIIKELETVLEDGQTLDGELYKHDWRSDSGEPDFQRITSAIKKYGKDTALLEYHVYDVPDDQLTFKERFVEHVPPISERVFRVPTYVVNNETEAMALYEKFITGAKPYEGAMLRNMDGLYMYDYRSYDLQKIKPLADAEYKIIGGEEASGNDINTVIFSCVTDNGNTFNVRPVGSREIRQKYWENLQQYIGKMLVVQYNGLTNSGLPRFPRGIRIREDWD
jgi:DNA ligase-1